MPATICAGPCRGTTGEWAGALRQVSGSTGPYRVSGGSVSRRRVPGVLARSKAMPSAGGPPKLLVAKPGLDATPTAEQIAVAAVMPDSRWSNQGIRLSPRDCRGRPDEDVDVWASRSSSARTWSSFRGRRPAACGGVDVPVVVGGIIPPEDAEILLGKGVARVYTPKDFEIGQMMDEPPRTGRAAPGGHRRLIRAGAVIRQSGAVLRHSAPASHSAACFATPPCRSLLHHLGEATGYLRHRVDSPQSDVRILSGPIDAPPEDRLAPVYPKVTAVVGMAVVHRAADSAAPW